MASTPPHPSPDDQDLFRAAIEAAGETVLITSPELNPPGPVILYVNPAFTRMTGYAAAEAIGQTPRMLQGPKTDQAELDRMRRELDATGTFRGEAVNYRKDGGEYVIDWLITAVRDPAGHVLRWVSVQRDVTERKQAQAQERLLVAELQHRVRNALGVIRSIARRTAATSRTVEDYAMHLDGRLDAIARVQAVVTRAPAAGVDLAALVANELQAYQAREGEQVTGVSGPTIRLTPKTAELFALAIHELATNAVKHGALATADGRVRAQWRVATHGEAPRLAFEWVESGVKPPAAAPERKGFGAELLERTLHYELGATTALAYGADGLRCRIELPLTDRNAIGSLQLA